MDEEQVKFDSTFASCSLRELYANGRAREDLAIATSSRFEFDEQANRATVATRGERESDTAWPVCLNNKAGRGARDAL